MSLRVAGSQRSDQVLDHILSTFTQEEQRELLDALAGEIDERLDTVVETADS
jgi:RNA binding exosome subunit